MIALWLLAVGVYALCMYLSVRNDGAPEAARLAERDRRLDAMRRMGEL